MIDIHVVMVVQATIVGFGMEEREVWTGTPAF